eukprot:UC1_evm2s1460
MARSQQQDAISFALSYGDHMVLQQAPQQANVWGFVSKYGGVTAVTVTITGPGVVNGGPKVTLQAKIAPYNATTSTWIVTLPAQPAAARGMSPVTITAATSRASTTISNVLFGEVWVCSGQSNMAFLLENSMNGAELVQEANSYPLLRFMTTKKTTSAVPLRELKGIEASWAISSNVSVSDDGKMLRVSSSAGLNDHHSGPLGDDNWLYMSAVCWLYGRNIMKARNVPVGLINTNWGGTAIEDWSSTEALAQCSTSSPTAAESPSLPMAEATALVERMEDIYGKSELPTHLFNAMVSPLLNHTIKGVIWYQGEANSGSPISYGCRQPAMIADWRAKWHAGSGGHTDALFPFGICQLAPVLGSPYSFTGLRWFQTGRAPSPDPLGNVAAYGRVPNPSMPNTFLGINIDLGDATSPFSSVHIRWKTEVAARLAAFALKQVYSDTTLHTGPVFAGLKYSSADGTAVRVTFNDTGLAGLALPPMNISHSHDMGNWTGHSPFEVCTPPSGVNISAACAMLSSDGTHWQEAKNTTLADGGETVVLAGAASKIQAVRLLWRAYPCEHGGCGIVSRAEGIPATPFWAVPE